MKKALKWLAAAVAAVVALVGGAAAWIALAPLPRYPVEKVEFPVDVTPERVARGRKTVEMLCAACHLDTAIGALTGKRMPDLPPRFGESWSLNVTADPVKGATRRTSRPWTTCNRSARPATSEAATACRT